MPMQMQKMEQKMEQKKEEQKKEEEKKKENSLSSSSFKWMRDQAQAQACYASHKQQHLVSSYTCVDKLEGSHTKTIRRCEFSRCDSMIASVSFDATTCIWDKKFGKHRHHHHHHYEQQQREEREVEEVDDFDEEDREGERDEQQWELLVTLEGHESEIKDVAWSPDGELLATCGEISPSGSGLRKLTRSSSASTCCKDTRKTSKRSLGYPRRESLCQRATTTP